MKISLLLVSKDEEPNVPRFLKGFRAQTKFPDEIVLIDSSKDNTREMLLNGFKTMCIDKIMSDKIEPYSCSRQRWYGMDWTTGDIILLTDIDAELHPDWIKEITKMFENPEVNIVQGQVTGYGWKEEDWMYSKHLPKIGKFLNHSNAAYRRKILECFPFDPDLKYGDDREMSYRLMKDGRYVVHGCKTARVWHHQNTHAKDIFGWNKQTWYHSCEFAMCMLVLAKKHKDIYWIARYWFNVIHSLKSGKKYIIFSIMRSLAFFWCLFHLMTGGKRYEY